MPDPAPAAPALRMQGVTLRYPGAAPVVQDVDLQVQGGEVLALVGASGTGKTTLLKAVAGILPAAKGRIEVLGVPRPRAPPRGSVGYIPQRLGLVHHATSLENVLMGALHRMPAWRAMAKVPPQAAVEEALAALERVGLAPKAQAPVKLLSGGQQRRVAVARALVQRPRLLLADEFLGELDRATADIVEGAVLALAEEHGSAILLVEHHVLKARRMADRVLALDAGRLVDITDPATAHSLVDDLDDDPGAAVRLHGDPHA